jgi:hypothetical protein
MAYVKLCFLSIFTRLGPALALLAMLGFQYEQITWDVRRLSASDLESGDSFGWSTSISGDILVIGAPDKESKRGAVYIFERDTAGTINDWLLVEKITASDPADDDQFGESLFLDGGTLVVGAPGKNSKQGMVYVFERGGGANGWMQIKKITASDPRDEDQFGKSVSVSGDVLIVGAYGKDSYQGAAYIFERNAGGTLNGWGQVQEIVASDPADVDYFGRSVFVSEDTLVVGAPYRNSNQGAAYIFERGVGGNWLQVEKITAFDPVDGACFGRSVFISGNTLVVGAPGENSHQGAAYVFERVVEGTASGWIPVKKIVALDPASGDYFGRSLSISGDILVVGAFSKDFVRGAAYAFERDRGETANDWGQIAKITAPSPANGDYFGSSVFIDGDALVIGAYGENSIQGAAYVFRLLVDSRVYLPLLLRSDTPHAQRAGASSDTPA